MAHRSGIVEYVSRRRGYARGIASVASVLILGSATGPSGKSFLTDPATAAALPAAQGALPKPPANGEMGFVLTSFSPAVHQGKEDCPEGLAGTVKDNYLLTLPASERSRLLLPASEVELTTRWKAYVRGPGNTNICTNVELFDRPIQKTVQGKISYGMNLDGDTGDGGKVAGDCAHENFTSPDGEAGIDNQLYRAQGCTAFYRGIDGTSGDLLKQADAKLANGELTLVLLLRGVDSLVKDDDVEVIFASTSDRPILDSNQKIVEGASFNVSKNPRWRNILHGRIENGVLRTQSADITLNKAAGFGGIRGQKLEWDFRAGRFQIAFQPDGTIKGLFGGYEPIMNVLTSERTGGIGIATVANVDCAGMYAALKKYADGLRDPKTGQCTAVSMAHNVTGVPAYVFDRPQAVALGKSDMLK